MTGSVLDVAREAGYAPIRDGREYKILCPEHGDNEPSLSLNEDKDVWYCGPCGKGGGPAGLRFLLGLRSNNGSSRNVVPSKEVDEVWRWLTEERGLPTSEARLLLACETKFDPSVVFPYTDEGGAGLYEKFRPLHPPKKKNGKEKKIFWRSPKGSKSALYGLSSLTGRVDSGVVIVEGEMDVHALRAVGLPLPVISLPDGCGSKLTEELFAPLAAVRLVYLAVDNDDAGERLAAQLAAVMHDRECRRVIFGEHKDANDALIDGWELQRFEEALAAASVVEAVVPVPTANAMLIDTNLTDVGAAERLVYLHGNDLGHVHEADMWLVWDGNRHRPDASGHLMKCAKNTARQTYAAAAKLAGDQRKAQVMKFARRAESVGKLRAMIELAKTEPGIGVAASDLDVHDFLFVCANGTLDLKTGQIRESRREDLMTKMSRVPFDSSANCPTWDGALDRWFDGDKKMIDFAQRAVGYSLTGNTQEEVVFLLHGPGANGKTKFLESIRGIAGDYGQTTDFSTFLERKSDGVRNDIARLAGSRFVTGAETDGQRRLAESVVKQATGRDKLAARFLFKEFFEFYPRFKLWLSTNHKPLVTGTDNGIWRRLRLIPFTVTIPEKERDPNLSDKLNAELPGILRWAVEGCLAWQRDGLGVPAQVIDATAAYREEMDILGEFITDCCAIQHGQVVVTKELYSAYVAWCQGNDEEPVKKRTFGILLGERGLAGGKHKGQRAWHGIGLHDGVGSATDVDTEEGDDVLF